MELVYFILGILFSQMASPLLESLIPLMSTSLEIRKEKMMAKYNYEIQKRDEEVPHRQIGFVVDAGGKKRVDEAL